MKTNLVAITLVSLMISACSSTPDSTPNSTAAESTSREAASETSTLSTSETSSSKLEASLQEMQRKSVYFDFDESVVKPEYRQVVQQQADFMKSHANIVFALEGNADERGSNEYNLALGDKRSNSVRKSLETSGVPANQLRIVSWGEERPTLACHEEKCWQENRRVDFIGKTGP